MCLAPISRSNCLFAISKEKMGCWCDCIDLAHLCQIVQSERKLENHQTKAFGKLSSETKGYFNYNSFYPRYFKRKLILSKFQELIKKWPRLKSSKRVIVHIPSLGYSEKIRRNMKSLKIFENYHMARISDIIGKLLNLFFLLNLRNEIKMKSILQKTKMSM